MFYSDFSDITKKISFELALETLKETFYRIYAADNLIAVDKTLGFLKDAKFIKSFEKYAESEQEKSLGWRLHTLIWATQSCLNIPGDFVECGVLKGFSSAVIADYHGFENVNKTMYLYDTFEGQPIGNDGQYRFVRSRFQKYGNIFVVKGILPGSLATKCPSKISFLHVDLNSADAEIGVLKALFDKVSTGGMVVLDDYGWLAHEDQKIALDTFFSCHSHSVLELPTGQGLVVKLS